MNKTTKSLIICLTILLSLFIQLTVNAKSIPFHPIPISPYQGAYWDVDIGDIFRYNVSEYEGQELLYSMDNSYKITGTDFISFFNDDYYCLTVRKMIYNESMGVFYEDPINTNIFNASLINFTIPKMYPHQGGVPFTFFIPKLDGNLMTDWVANASYFQYKNSFDPYSPAEIFTNSNTIRYFNSTTGEYIEFQYCNDGSLKSGYWYFVDYRLKADRLYPECDEVPNITPTVPIGASYMIFLLVSIIGLVLYLLKKIEIKTKDI